MAFRFTSLFLLAFICTPWISHAQTTVTVSAIDGSASEVPGDPAIFRFQRTGGGNGAALDVRFRLEGTASGFGTDYLPDPEPAGAGFGNLLLTIPAGSDSADLNIIPSADNIAEGDETVLARLSSGSYDIGDPNEAAIVIVDDPAVVTITSPDPSASETGPDSGRFLFERTGGDISAPLIVRFVVEGDATGFGTDYDLQPDPTGAGFGRWNLTIPQNETSLEVVLTPVADVAAEGDETATFRLSPNGSFLAGTLDSASIVIADDAPVVTVTATDANASELGPDAASLRFSRSGGDPNSPISVTFDLTGSALESDYVSDPVFIGRGFGRLGIDIPAGADFVDVEIMPLADADETEGEETLTVSLIARPQYSLGNPDTASIAIADFVQLVFRNGFESVPLQVCNVKAASARNPQRFHDSGLSVLDLESDKEWLVCDPMLRFDWVKSSCVEQDSGGLHAGVLNAFNQGRIGDNNGFSDWRYASTREKAEVGAAGNCLLRNSR